METGIDPRTVTLRPSSLFDACLVGLESGEFRQVRGALARGAGGRCAWGVIRTIAERAGLDYLGDVHPQFAEIERRAGAILGYAGIADANDAGVPFGLIAGALRQAHVEIAGPAGPESALCGGIGKARPACGGSTSAGCVGRWRGVRVGATYGPGQGEGGRIRARVVSG